MAINATIPLVLAGTDLKEQQGQEWLLLVLIDSGVALLHPGGCVVAIPQWWMARSPGTCASTAQGRINAVSCPLTSKLEIADLTMCITLVVHLNVVPATAVLTSRHL